MVQTTLEGLVGEAIDAFYDFMSDNRAFEIAVSFVAEELSKSMYPPSFFPMDDKLWDDHISSCWGECEHQAALFIVKQALETKIDLTRGVELRSG